VSTRPYEPGALGDPAAAPGADAAFLRVEEVTVRFGGLTALDAVSFDVARGTVHAVIGPNGAGKSTLFNVLSGFYKANSGRVTLEGAELTGRKPHELPRMGLGRTFQQPGLFKQMTVVENLLLARHIAMHSGFIANGFGLPRSRSEERAARAEMLELAELLGVQHVLDSRAGEISYGEQKRVEIARALGLRPKVLLFDEPVAGMNAFETAEMTAVLAKLPGDFGVTVVLVEHDMHMVMSVASRVTVLDFGRRIAEAPPAQIQNDPAVRAAYLGTKYKPHDVGGAA
jgi:branched-chain amino acid transport system ATP-binding protein